MSDSPQMSPDKKLPRWTQILLLGHLIVQWALYGNVLRLPADNLILGRFSPRQMQWFVLTSACAVTVLVLFSWLRPQNRALLWGYALIVKFRRSFLWLLLAVGMTLAALILAFYYLPRYGYVSAHLLLAVLMLYLAKPAVWETKGGRLFELIPIIVLASAIGLRIWFLYAEFIWIDEGYYLSLASNMLHGGRIVPAMFYVPSDVPILPIWGYAVAVYGYWARLTSLDVFSLRWLSYLISLPALLFLYLIVKQWYGRNAAIVSTSFASLSFLFMHATVARNNALPLLMVSITLFVHVVAVSRKKPVLHAVVGALAVLTLEAHLTGLVFIVVFGSYYTFDYVRGALQEKKWIRPAPLWYFLLGLLPVLVVYFYLHIFIASSPDQYFSYLGSARLTGGGGSGGIPQYLKGLLDRADYRFRGIWVPAPLDVLLIAVSFGAAGIRRTDSDRHWLFLMMATIAGYTVIEPRGHIHYLVYGLPVFYAGTGPFIVYALGRKEQPLGKAFPRITYISLAFVMVVWLVIEIRHRHATQQAWQERVAPIVEYVRGHFPADAVIEGPPTFFAYIPEYRNYMFISPAVHASRLAQEDPSAYWTEILLETWPAARITRDGLPSDEISPIKTYTQSRQMSEVIPDLWIPHDAPLVPQGLLGDSQALSTLQLAAYLDGSPASSGDRALLIETIWVTRGDIDDDLNAKITLFADEDYETIQPIVSGWAGTPTSDWGAYEFHDVTFEVDIPSRLGEGEYTLQIEVQTVSGIPSEACQPNCVYQINELAVHD